MTVNWEEPKVKVKIYRLKEDFCEEIQTAANELLINREYKKFLEVLKKAGYQRIPSKAYTLVCDAWTNGRDLDDVYLKMSQELFTENDTLVKVGDIVQVEYASEKSFQDYGCWYVDRDHWERVGFPYYEAEVNWDSIIDHMTAFVVDAPKVMYKQTNSNLSGSYLPF